MFPLLFQAFPVTQANAQLSLKLASSFVDGLRRLSELNRDVVQRSFAENNENGPIALFMQFPVRAYAYASDIASITNGTARSVVEALSGSIGSDQSQSHNLVLVSGGKTAAGETAILDANGVVVRRVVH